jgi:hypothetical protein
MRKPYLRERKLRKKGLPPKKQKEEEEGPLFYQNMMKK